MIYSIHKYSLIIESRGETNTSTCYFAVLAALSDPLSLLEQFEPPLFRHLCFNLLLIDPADSGHDSFFLAVGVDVLQDTVELVEALGGFRGEYAALLGAAEALLHLK